MFTNNTNFEGVDCISLSVLNTIQSTNHLCELGYEVQMYFHSTKHAVCAYKMVYTQIYSMFLDAGQWRFRLTGHFTTSRSLISIVVNFFKKERDKICKSVCACMQQFIFQLVEGGTCWNKIHNWFFLRFKVKWQGYIVLDLYVCPCVCPETYNFDKIHIWCTCFLGPEISDSINIDHLLTLTPCPRMTEYGPVFLHTPRLWWYLPISALQVWILSGTG